LSITAIEITPTFGGNLSGGFLEFDCFACLPQAGLPTVPKGDYSASKAGKL